MALIATWFSERNNPEGKQQRQELMDALHHLPTYLGMTLRVQAQMREIANDLKDRPNMFILGKGYGYPIALEGALKVKVRARLWAREGGGGRTSVVSCARVCRSWRTFTPRGSAAAR